MRGEEVPHGPTRGKEELLRQCRVIRSGSVSRPNRLKNMLEN